MRWAIARGSCSPRAPRDAAGLRALGPLPGAGAAPSPEGVEGAIDLPGARGRVAWSYHFDRNALAAAQASGKWLIAASAAGDLLRFDASTLALDLERVGQGVVRCLGRGEGGEVLAGLEDGRVARVDPLTLALTPLAELGGEPFWVGGGKRGVVAVVEHPGRARPRGASGREPPTYEAVEVASGVRVKLPPVSAAFYDSSQRLWVGADPRDEPAFVGVVDFEAERLRKGEGWVSYVHGFLERGGKVLAYGSFFDVNAGLIAFVSGYDGSGPAPRPGPPRRYGSVGTQAPASPIAHVVEGGPGGALIAVTYDGIFRTDSSFTHWGEIGDPDLRRPRDDLYLGVPPSEVRALWPQADGRLLLATARDGLVRLSAAGVEQSAVPDQLEANLIERIVVTPQGALVGNVVGYEGGPERVLWQRRAGRWARQPALPAGEPSSGGPPDPNARWGDYALHVEPDGSLVTFAQASLMPGRRVVMRWRGDAGETLWESPSSDLITSSSFMTPDGTLWAVSEERLLRFEKGGFRPAGRAPRYGARVETIGAQGPPWLLLDRIDNVLLRLDPGRATLERLEVRDREGKLRIYDAVPWARGWLLVATEGGLGLLPTRGGRIVEPPFAAPKGVERLARDAKGRFWLGGEGLWVYDPKGGPPFALDAVPAVGRRRVSALVADAGRPGVVVGFQAALAFLTLSD